MRISLLSLLLLPLFCCSCSMVLCNTVPTKTGAAMRPGAARAELVSRLGQPSMSTSVPVPATVRLLRTNSPPCSCDIYHVSGLVQVGDDTYSTDWNVYPAFVIVTLGLAEVVMFPYVVVDMTARSFQRRELRVWYDCSDELVAWERRRRRED